MRPLTRHGVSTHADRGFSLVEVLVAVVLLSMAVVGTLTALNAAIRGSHQQGDHGGSRKWLVSAADYVVSSGVPRVSCIATGGGNYAVTAASATAVRAAYQAAAQSITNARPAGYTAANLVVSAPVLFWGNGTNGTTFGTNCYDNTTSRSILQQVTLTVTSPDGKVTESVTVVKRDG